MKNISLIAFDFDGTMADTEELTLPDFWAFLQEDYGITVTREDWMANYHGKAGPSLLSELNAAYGTKLEWPSFVAARNKRLPRLFAAGVHLAPGLTDVLEHLHNGKLTYCICTNSQAARNVMALDGLRNISEEMRTHLQNNCFSGVEEGRTAKPAPDVYNDAAKHFGVSPAQSIAIEDTVAGLKAAIDAGFVALGYTGLSRTPEEDTELLAAAGAHAVFNHWDAFLPLLETLEDPS
ncbi:MAG: hypothetical protein COY40_01310 [Alphaproteobacteria bacterium CG_4_10_14_0_8_um_filter_53_9]|nr:MAG: hypothetical protein COY40_01310 [Alphaproteobacteria bacterium CG_4_10_14_0_8_um_filter_53_9]